MLRNSRLKKITAWTAMAAVVFVMLFSVLFISRHVHHECTGEDCPVCAEMMQCSDNVKNISMTVVVATTVFLSCQSVRKKIQRVMAVYSTGSLISQKVRMNN